jgi:hypothetical protein
MRGLDQSTQISSSSSCVSTSISKREKPTQSRADPCFPPQIDQKLKKDSYNMSFSCPLSMFPCVLMNSRTKREGYKSTETQRERERERERNSAYLCLELSRYAKSFKLVQLPWFYPHPTSCAITWYRWQQQHTSLIMNKSEIYNPEHDLQVKTTTVNTMAGNPTTHEWQYKPSKLQKKP